MISRILALLLLAPLIVGCTETLRGSIPGGESKVFTAPPYVVKGRAQYDQNIIDDWVEGGVAAYGWKRPAPRPASIDAPTKRAVKTAAPPKKRGLIKRIKDRVVHPFTKPVAPIVESPPVASLPAPVVQAPPPRDPVDELLHPEGGR